MPLPTDNETEGVIITASPTLSVGGLVSPIPRSPLVMAALPATAIAPHFMPFGRTLRERWLWLTCVLALFIFVAAYQFFPDYSVSLNDGVMPSYSSAPLRLGDGWHPAATPVQPPYIIGLRTSAIGYIYLPNFGYAIGTGAYALESNVVATRPLSFTVSIGTQLIGTYAAQEQEYKPTISIPAAAFLAAGPHPSIAFAVTRFAPATPGNIEPTLILDSFYLRSPSAFVISVPPLLIMLNVALAASLCFLALSKRYPPPQLGSKALYRTAIILLANLYIWLKPAERLDISSRMLEVTIGVALITLVIWRRELANWILHLRHPDDERFIVR